MTESIVRNGVSFMSGIAVFNQLAIEDDLLIAAALFGFWVAWVASCCMEDRA